MYSVFFVPVVARMRRSGQPSASSAIGGKATLRPTSTRLPATKIYKAEKDV
jgi:hypothetical protein